MKVYPTKNPDFVIREACADDAQLIFDLVCGLAEYEKLRDQVEGDPETLRRNLFEEKQANEFNLNIPRYVDTFEEEELIDIEEVQGNIERIKAEIAVVEAQMAQYLKELGL